MAGGTAIESAAAIAEGVDSAEVAHQVRQALERDRRAISAERGHQGSVAC